MRENDAETIDIAPAGINYGLLNAFFFCFFFFVVVVVVFVYSFLSKILSDFSKKIVMLSTILSPTSTIFLFSGCEISWKPESSLCKY